MMLGNVLARLTDEPTAAELVFSLGGLPMLAAARQQAAAEGIDLASYTRDAVQCYAARASDEEWTTLMGHIGRASDPGLACLKRALEHATRGQNAF